MLAAELPHLVKARLELPVSRVDAPHHLQVLLPLPFDDVSQQHLELLILIVPRLKDFEASHHDLCEMWEMGLSLHRISSLVQGGSLRTKTYFFKFLISYMHQLPSAQDFEQLRTQVPGNCLHKAQGPLNGVFCVSDLSQMCENCNKSLSYFVQLSGR